MKVTFTAIAKQILLLEKCEVYLNAKRRHKNLVSQRQRCTKQLETIINNNNFPNNVEHVQLELVGIIDSIEHDSKLSGLGLMNLRIRGAKEFIRLTRTSESSAKLAKLDHAEFLFRRSIQFIAGSFNKQHGNMELTARRGMLAMERRDDIFKTTTTAFPDNAGLNGKVCAIMEWWREAATLLFKLGKQLESQNKVTPEHLSTLKKLIVDFGLLWRDKIGPIKNPVYWKLHALECCLVNFVESTGMTGRASAQGFEHKHFLTGKLRNMLDPMIQTNKRVQKQSQRQQVNLLTGVAKRMKKIEDNTIRTGPQGTYATKGKTTRNNEDHVEANEIDSEMENAPDGFFEVDNGGLLPDNFFEPYNYFKKSQMPDDWIVSFIEDEELGTKAKLEAKFYKA